MISILSASLNCQRVLDRALDLGASVLANSAQTDGHMVGAALLYGNGHRNGNELHVASALRFTSADMCKTLPGRSGMLQRVIESGESRLFRQPAEDPELGRFISLRNCKSVYCLPLRSGLDTYGVLLFGHPERSYFNAEKREILDLIGNQAMIAIQNACLYRELEVEKERMMAIQEGARKKLARDLHDGPTQLVSTLAMRINIARRLLEKERTAAAADELNKIEELARRTTKEIRHMLFTLRPLMLETQGLIATLQSMAEKIGEIYNQEVIIEAEAEVASRLEMSRQAVIFYLAEEAVDNARKHAQAAHIWVRLKTLADDLVELEVEDDGRGLDPVEEQANCERRGSLGMINMCAHTELINGLLHIDSVPGRGTRLQVEVPITKGTRSSRHGCTPTLNCAGIANLGIAGYNNPHGRTPDLNIHKAGRGALIHPRGANSLLPYAGELYYHVYNAHLVSQPALVLVHGAGGTHLFWPTALRRLAGYRVYALDLPGHGKSGGRGRQSIASYAEAVMAWLEAVRLHRAVFAGHSMGSAIALTLALRHPERVMGIALLGGGACLRVAPSLLDETASPTTYHKAIHSIVRWSFSPHAAPKLVETAAQRLEETRRSVLHGDLHACDAFDLTRWLADVRAPALVMCGALDKMTPLSLSRQLAAGLPQAELRIIPEAGHMLMLEKPEEVAAALAEFLEDLSRR